MTPAPQVPLAPPQRLARAVALRHGARGTAWLAALPALAAECLQRWELAPLRVQQPGGTAALVVPVTAPGGVPAVLKLSVGPDGPRHEAAALARWDGRGAVRLLASDPERGALLLERVHGQVSLRSLPDAKAMLEAAGVVRRLWVDPGADAPFPALDAHTARLAAELAGHRDRPWAAAAAPLVDEALALRAGLLADAPVPVLLHGGLHHGKVLAADRAPWLAAGPVPLTGDPAYDVARLARDRLETLLASPSADAAVRRRTARLADGLGLDAERLRGWTLFRTVVAGMRLLARGEHEAGELALEFAGRL